MLKKWLIDKLNEPTGLRIEWMTGGFRFAPPLWTWLVLILIEIVFAWWMT